LFDRAVALLRDGRSEEALTLTGGASDPQLRRLQGYVLQQLGRNGEAAAAYEAAVAAAPDDFESWNNLGNCRLALGDAAGAVTALRRAAELAPAQAQAPVNANLARALEAAGDDAGRRAALAEAVRLAPHQPGLRVELGLACAALQDFGAAEAEYRAALRTDPSWLPAVIELGMLLEHLNRVGEFEALVAQAEQLWPDSGEIGFLKAWLLRRQRRYREALDLAERSPPTLAPGRRAQLIGEAADRLGLSERAFTAFAEMNAIARSAMPPAPGPSYREAVAASAARLTPQWVASWARIALPPGRPDPIFIVGFPRSGTTLLDTLLMNLPELHVLEEVPALGRVQEALGDEARLATLTAGEVADLRRLYFEAVEALAPPRAGQRLVDKYPLNMARMPLVHRLFPDAAIVFVERHPCDAVLSCFIANFSLNFAMRSFLDLDEAARTYDAVFEAWSRAESVLPLKVHRVRYERMVEDPAAELRPLLAFLGLEWSDALLDNAGSAARRGYIATPSYHQVAEPITAQAVGRWRRYRTQLAPVLPVLAPWAERMGYPL
ncbi:MAG TPA: sulfotransferase, partial [Allosphingosinicella sp.]|nr:sulfotransferase [Allosphingosinicella sp.]